ncbi:hypothetical protein [Mesorhizobium sp. M1348]|uniref:hypothetical protein n=1 Tax=unclassified Mesorhizobium TaxID=325217 RepID=UPI003334CC28
MGACDSIATICAFFYSDQLGTHLPQDIELFSGCVRDNIARFRADAADAQVTEAATHASVPEMIQRLPTVI